MASKRSSPPQTPSLILQKSTFLRASASLLALCGLSGQAVAQTDVASEPGASPWSGFLPEALGSVEIMMLASFGGAMCFALLAATWMIRERSRMVTENARLGGRISDLKAGFERMEALINTTDQRIVVWDAKSEAPTIHGRLSQASGAPDERQKFLAFGTWLTPQSAANFENAIRTLRIDASAFDICLETKGGSIIETQGRTSGSHAFVRFVEITEERAKAAKLEIDHGQLQASFDSIQALFDTLDCPVWLRNSDGDLYWTNKAYSDAVEAENPAAAIEKSLHLFDQNERETIKAAHRESHAFKGKLPAVIKGDRKLLEVVDAVTNAGNAGLAIDRSDLQNMEALLAKTEASQAKMLDQLAAAVAIFDNTRHLRFFNSSFQQLWDLDAQFLESNPSHGDVIDAIRSKHKLPEQQDWKKWREQQTEVYQSLEPIDDWWFLPDGQTLRVIASPQAQGGASWTFENVTEQLALESNYNQLVRMQGETLDHLSEAVGVFGSDGKLRLSNPALNTLWNLNAVDVTGVHSIADNKIAQPKQHISDLLDAWQSELEDPEQLSEIRQKITGFDEDRQTQNGRLDLRDGRILDYALVPLPEGQTMLTLVDVSASVNMARALQERAEALEESDQIKSRFLQHVSYELRAPLTTIAGFGEMLSMPEIGTLNPKQQEYLGHINTSSGTLRAIIDDILDLATIDAGAMVLDLERVSLNAIVDESLTGLAEAIAERSLNVSREIGPDCEELIADPARLLQILFNLLSNAVKHSPDGGTITLAAIANNGYVEISVQDEGKGIPAEARERAFDRFESGMGKDEGKGTGLGLSIVKSFVELHGGSAEISDTQKRGTKIICRIPITPMVDAEAAE